MTKLASLVLLLTACATDSVLLDEKPPVGVAIAVYESQSTVVNRRYDDPDTLVARLRYDGVVEARLDGVWTAAYTLDDDSTPTADGTITVTVDGRLAGRLMADGRFVKPDGSSPFSVGTIGVSKGERMIGVGGEGLVQGTSAEQRALRVEGATTHEWRRTAHLMLGLDLIPGALAVDSTLDAQYKMAPSTP